MTIRASRSKEETNFKIFKATLEIATTKGVGAVTMEEVARQSGVAKTTIYRRYANSQELLKSICDFDNIRVPNVEHLSPSHENFVRLLELLEERFSQSFGVRAVGVILSGGNEFFRSIVKNGVLPVAKNMNDFFHRGQQQGVIREGIDIEIIIENIIGSLVSFYAFADISDTANESDKTHQNAGISHSWAQREASMLWPAISSL